MNDNIYKTKAIILEIKKRTIVYSYGYLYHWFDMFSMTKRKHVYINMVHMRI